jgi:hypothetical protein
MEVFEGGLELDMFADKHLTIEATNDEQKHQIIELLKATVNFGTHMF